MYVGGGMTDQPQTCAYPPCEAERTEDSDLCAEHMAALDWTRFSFQRLRILGRPVPVILAPMAAAQNAAEAAIRPGGLTLPGQMPPGKPGNGRH